MRRRKSAQDLALRSRIVLDCATGVSNSEVSRRQGVSLPTVRKWRARFLERRLDGLVDEPRPGRPALIGVDRVEQVIVDTLESTPKNATHWSRAKMAERSGLSKSTVGRIWKAFGLKPHLEEGFKLSNDPMFTEKVYDIVGLYLNPPESAVVLSVDEKSQVQALARSQPAFPMMPGVPERRTHDYIRHGTTSLFAAMNVQDGTVISSVHRKHRSGEFKKFLQKIDKTVPGRCQIFCVRGRSVSPSAVWSDGESVGELDGERVERSVPALGACSELSTTDGFDVSDAEVDQLQRCLV